MTEYLILAGAALVCLMVLLAGRWKRCVAGVVVSAALLAGCATTPTEPVGGPVTQFACAPEGLPTLDPTWQVVDTRVGMVTKTESGAPIAMTLVSYSREGAALLLGFVSGELAVVDLHPLDQGVPLMANAQFIAADGTVRAEPTGECSWFALLTGDRT